MKALRLTAAALALSLLCGCGLDRGIYSNYRAIEELQLVETLGVDRVDGSLVLSAAAGKSSAGGAPAVLRAPARDLVQGLSALQDRAVRGQVFFAHVQHLVLGEDSAAQDVGALLDYIERDVHTRMGTDLYVVRGGTAESLVTGAGDDWSVSDVLASVRSETALRGDSHVFDVRETAVALSEYGAALVCALRLAGTEGEAYAVAPGLLAVPAGYAVLRGGVLAGYLDGGEARAASLLLGTLGAVPLTLRCDGGTAAVELRCARPDFAVVRGADDAPVGLELRARPEAVIAALDGADIAPDAVCDAVDRLLEEELARVVARSQAMEADFLALGRALRTHGVDPARLSAHWLRDADVRVSVRTEMTRSYDMGAPASTDGGGW